MKRIPEVNEITIILLAGGSGERFGGFKQLIPLPPDKTLIHRNLRIFRECGYKNFILVLHEALIERFSKELRYIEIVSGGETRSQSTYNGLEKVKTPFVFVHDVARPFINCELLERLRKGLGENDVVIPVIKEVDTVIESDGEYLKGLLDRNKVYRVQTPQAFRTEMLKKAFEQAKRKDFTDESTLIYTVLGIPAKLVKGDPENVKITYKEDILKMGKIKTFLGYDIHRLKQGGVLKIGGVVVKEGISPIAHSDGDVVLHALIDALVSAIGKGDIGELFPPEDPKWKDMDSREFIKILKSKYQMPEILHVDITCIAEVVRLKPFRDRIISNIAEILSIPRERISFKARTKEGIGAIGRGEAIESFVILTCKSV